MRERHRLKTRQPLRRVTIVHHLSSVREAVDAHRDLVAEELNVKEVIVTGDDGQLATLSFKANFKTLGRRFGKQMKAAAARIAQLSNDEWSVLADGGEIEIEGQMVTADDVMVHREPKGDVFIEVDAGLTVALDHHLDDDLLHEGWSREITSRIQRLRKESGLDVTDRIRLGLYTASTELNQAIAVHRSAIMGEVLASQVDILDTPVDGEVTDIEGHALTMTVEKDV